MPWWMQTVLRHPTDSNGDDDSASGDDGADENGNKDDTPNDDDEQGGDAEDSKLLKALASERKLRQEAEKEARKLKAEREKGLRSKLPLEEQNRALQEENRKLRVQQQLARELDMQIAKVPKGFEVNREDALDLIADMSPDEDTVPQIVEKVLAKLKRPGSSKPGLTGKGRSDGADKNGGSGGEPDLDQVDWSKAGFREWAALKKANPDLYEQKQRDVLTARKDRWRPSAAFGTVPQQSRPQGSGRSR